MFFLLLGEERERFLAKSEGKRALILPAASGDALTVFVPKCPAAWCERAGSRRETDTEI